MNKTYLGTVNLIELIDAFKSFRKIEIHMVFTLYFRFTQNLSVFRRDVNDSLKAPSGSASNNNNVVNMSNDMMS